MDVLIFMFVDMKTSALMYIHTHPLYIYIYVYIHSVTRCIYSP